MRDIDKEKKDQRKAESLALREVRKQQVLQTVLRASSLSDAAKTLDTNTEELRARLEKYGVKHEFGERWNVAVKDYLDAGQPHQYELMLLSISDDETELEEQLELDIEKVDYTMNPVVELVRKEGERVKYWENKGYQTNALHTPYRASKAFNPATYNPSEK